MSIYGYNPMLQHSRWGRPKMANITYNTETYTNAKGKGKTAKRSTTIKTKLLPVGSGPTLALGPCYLSQHGWLGSGPRHDCTRKAQGIMEYVESRKGDGSPNVCQVLPLCQICATSLMLGVRYYWANRVKEGSKYNSSDPLRPHTTEWFPGGDLEKTPDKARELLLFMRRGYREVPKETQELFGIYVEPDNTFWRILVTGKP